jgi:hypothetical protein
MNTYLGNINDSKFDMIYKHYNYYFVQKLFFLTEKCVDTCLLEPNVATPLLLIYLLKLDTNDKIKTQLYDKRDYFNFSFVNFPYLCSDIPASPAYGLYILQLIRHAKACLKYDQFLVRGSLLTNKLMA